jgi:hypothetical protein
MVQVKKRKLFWVIFHCVGEKRVSGKKFSKRIRFCFILIREFRVDQIFANVVFE